VFPPSIVPESASNFQIEIVFGRLLVTTIGLDVAKSVFQVHGVDAAGQVVIRRQVKRRYVMVQGECARELAVWIGMLNESCAGRLGTSEDR
jgi:hypothetical protein